MEPTRRGQTGRTYVVTKRSVIDTDRKRLEMSAELRRARAWILGVGIVMYGVDMYLNWTQHADDWTAGLRYRASLIAGCVLLAFVALWWFARKWPRTCCVLALVVYWGIHVAAAIATGDPAELAKGALIKVLFTLALIKGIMSARNAAAMRAELEEVFG